MAKDCYVIGVYFGHNASVALAINGVLVFVLQEERLTGIKTYTGFPTKAYQYMVEHFLDGDPNKVDLVVLPTSGNSEYLYYLHENPFPDGRYKGHYSNYFKNEIPESFKVRDENFFDDYLQKDLARFEASEKDAVLSEEAFRYYEKQLGIKREKILLMDHHLSHACSTCYGIDPEQNWLIFTLDGGGDNVGATVNTFRSGNITVLSKNLRYYSLARFYKEITGFLGMKPIEHEAKVMGLAAYSKSDQWKPIYEKFKDIISVDKKCNFTGQFSTGFTRFFLLENCIYDRFDAIAGAAQYFIEERIMEWIHGWIEKTGIHNVAVAGGIFMNVKLNQRINEDNKVSNFYVIPSCGDESTVLGCCYHGTRQILHNKEIQPLKSLDLGIEYTNRQIQLDIENKEVHLQHKIQFVDDIDNEVANLLANGNIVGRFNGRSEFGARALGNRSILANPSDRQNVEVINNMIKGRDFWMPFAPSILEEQWEDYVNSNRTKVSTSTHYMMITFLSKSIAKDHLPAALHHGDQTTRPQIVTADWEPSYHRLISLFKERSGIGGILNTSMNLHGEPLVTSPIDALHVFESSGLPYLALGNWLLSKKRES